MSRIQEEGSYVSLGDGKWGKIVTNEDGTPIGGGGTGTAGVEYNATPPTATDGETGPAQGDINLNTKVVEQNAPVAEDNEVGVFKVEHRYSVTRVTGDAQIKGSPGFIHTITIAPTTATPTAGLLTVYNNTAESGTVLYSEWVFATTPGHTVTLDCPASTGIYVGYDGTLANVSVSVSWR